MPSDFPCWQTVYYYFKKWDKDGAIDLIISELIQINRVQQDKEILPSALVIDTQSVKNSATATQSIGIEGGKLIKGRKRLFLTDTLGNLVWVKVVAANEYDGKIAQKACEEFALMSEFALNVQLIYADSTFGGSFKEWAKKELEWEVEITKTGHVLSQDGKFYISPKRWVVERSFAWTNNARRLSKEYERKTSTPRSFYQVATH